MKTTEEKLKLRLLCRIKMKLNMFFLICAEFEVENIRQLL